GPSPRSPRAPGASPTTSRASPTGPGPRRRSSRASGTTRRTSRACRPSSTPRSAPSASDAARPVAPDPGRSGRSTAAQGCDGSHPPRRVERPRHASRRPRGGRWADGQDARPGTGSGGSVTRIKVLVVDDSVVVRRLVSDALSSDPRIEVVGVAADGRIAVQKAALLRPDAITMDVEMPVCDGIEAVRTLRADGVRVPIVMFSTLTDHGAAATLDALAAGADDYVTKPTDVRDLAEAMGRVRDELVPR